MTQAVDAETARIAEMRDSLAWRRWGPYLSERQWGTVREDYSADGDAWNYLPHDHARSRAYRWGEDGIGGFADDRLRICLSIALWNERDAILKERLYGLTNAEGNHGEDVKELYYYVDAVPSHAYMKMVYKYPQGAFPYEQLREANASRRLDQGEYELIDTGIFANDRYFDVEIEYAKADTDDILLRIVAHNRGPDAAPLHILPQIWFRNGWSWAAGKTKPALAADPAGGIAVSHPDFDPLHWQCAEQGGGEDAADLLFCENETNTRRLFGSDVTGWFKDGINDAVTAGRGEAVNPAHHGTKAAAHVIVSIPPGGSHEVRVRLAPTAAKRDFSDFTAIFAQRRAEADAFYAARQVGIADPDARLVHRQALAGMMWCKQFYGYDVWRWLQGDPLLPPPPAERLGGRNRDWRHLALGDVDAGSSGDIMSMPDSWEYPWFAAWDLAFHAVTLARVDPDFAKHQLLLLTQARALHPSGQMPAYEWNFDDVNPPVHAWAALQVFLLDRVATGTGDFAFLKRIFHKLLLNFTWWVNREDADGNNIFQGGFLGLDNIGIFDLRVPLPDGGHLDQSDGTAWAAMYALNMLALALELSGNDPAYEDMATKFFEHFIFIAEAVNTPEEAVGARGLWDEADQFYYDVFRVPGAPPQLMRVRSMVGLLPMFASLVLPANFDAALPKFRARLAWFAEHRPDLAALVSDWQQPGPQGTRALTLLRKHRLNALLTRMLDETEFLSPHGIRSVSKYHDAHPFSFAVDGQVLTLSYEPAEGRTRIYGGNSNWRGPVWMPMNYLIVSSLRMLHKFYGDSFQMACPTGSANMATLDQIADELSRRLQTLFLRDQSGMRAYLGSDEIQQHNRDFSELLLFHEYFDGDTGKGLGASHQTGWTGLIALLIAQRDKEITL
ncbi:MAG: glucosidase [Pseudomonadota bacterium]|nr:glucosidase [Pseudomonadota bacterium]